MKTFLINKIYFYSFPRGQLHIEKMSYLPFCVLGGEEKRGLCLNHIKPLKSAQPKLLD